PFAGGASSACAARSRSRTVGPRSHNRYGGRSRARLPWAAGVMAERELQGSAPSLRAGGRAAVTVIVPAYNEAESIAETVRSLLEQTVPPVEIVVVDDCST